MGETMAQSLSELFDYLDGLDDRASLEELTAQFRRTLVTCADVADSIRFSDRGYTRNLVRAGPWYNLLVLCWKNGQRSPIHDHKGSSCAVRVLRGTATETVFGMTDEGRLFECHTHRLPEGFICATQDLDIHQISNLQPGAADLITLHIYSPPLLVMG